MLAEIRTPPAWPVRSHPAALAGWVGERAQRLPRRAAGVVPGSRRRPRSALVGRLLLDGGHGVAPAPAATATLGERAAPHGTGDGGGAVGHGIRAPQHSHDDQRVDDERRMVPVARFAVAMPAVYFLVSLDPPTGQRRPTAVRRPPIPDRLARRPAWHHAPALPRTGQLAHADRPPHRRDHGGRRDHRLHLATPRGVGRTRPGHPLPPLAGLGRRLLVRADRQPLDPLRAPCGTVSRPEHPLRHRVLQWWIAWLLAGFLSTAAAVSALFSTGAALVVSVPAVIACLAVIAWAPGIVLAIAAIAPGGRWRRRTGGSGVFQG